MENIEIFEEKYSENFRLKTWKILPRNGQRCSWQGSQDHKVEIEGYDFTLEPYQGWINRLMDQENG